MSLKDRSYSVEVPGSISTSWFTLFYHSHQNAAKRVITLGKVRTSPKEDFWEVHAGLLGTHDLREILEG